MSSFFKSSAAICCATISFSSLVASSALRDGLTLQLPTSPVSFKLASQTTPQQLQREIPVARSTQIETFKANPSLPPTYFQNLRLPLVVPAPISSPFGDRVYPISGQRKSHKGIDFAADYGAPVVAALSGQVVYVGDYGGYGNIVVLRHNSEFYTLYAHLSETYAQLGTWIEQNTIIASVGSTGYSTGPHLHFEIRILRNGTWYAVDPALYLGNLQDQSS